MIKTFHIFANAALGEGLSGSDRIFIEFSKRLSKKFNIFIYVWSEGYRMCLRQNLKESKSVKFAIMNVYFWPKMGFLICYLYRIFASCMEAIKLNISESESVILYSASEFWMDSLPAFILKMRYPKVRWIAAWFQTAPNPVKGFSEGKRKSSYKLSALYYWLMQLPIRPLIKKYADFVLVNNELEKKQFSAKDKQNKVLVILGAVNMEAINSYIENSNKQLIIYDGVFQGRFHPQKGVLELIDIWKFVFKKLPKAQLAMIGDGPLMNKVKLKIKDEKLENNIKLFGYVFDGPTKYRIFSQSKIVLHPAFYDSGGMASAEAMAFGLPCIGFDLESYHSYYPKEMIKIKIGDLESFADMVVTLIKDQNRREKLGKEAKQVIIKNWSWDQRVDQLLGILKGTESST